MFGVVPRPIPMLPVCQFRDFFSAYFYPLFLPFTMNVFCSLINLHTVKPVLRGHSKRRPKIGFQDLLLLHAGQKYCIAEREHSLSAVLLTFIKLPFVIILSLFCLFLSGRSRQVLLYFGSLIDIANNMHQDQTAPVGAV